MFAASALVNPVSDKIDCNSIGNIPVRNLWLLMLYASQLFKHLNRGKCQVEDNPDDIPDLVAEFLIHAVQQRLKRNLSFGYQQREAALNRVRGRIDVLQTERHQLMSRGKIACQFDDLTINTPRNCYVRSALSVIARIVRRPEHKHQCLSLVNSLRQLGVVGEQPTYAQISAERFGRHDVDDQMMVTAAHLAFNLALPTEVVGKHFMVLPDREIHWVRRLYEKAIAGFYGIVLPSAGWHVSAGTHLNWQITGKTAGIDNVLPKMKTDIVLENASSQQRIIIDTKFTSILKKGWYRESSVSSGYLYQMYAYLMSQTGKGYPLADRASGLLLHPSVGEMFDETVIIQNHAIRFATVDLAASTLEIRQQLLSMIDFPLRPEVAL